MSYTRSVAALTPILRGDTQPTVILARTDLDAMFMANPTMDLGVMRKRPLTRPTLFAPVSAQGCALSTSSRPTVPGEQDVVMIPNISGRRRPLCHAQPILNVRMMVRIVPPARATPMELARTISSWVVPSRSHAGLLAAAVHLLGRGRQTRPSYTKFVAARMFPRLVGAQDIVLLANPRSGALFMANPTSTVCATGGRPLIRQ